MSQRELYDLLRQLRKTLSCFRDTAIEAGSEVIDSLNSQYDDKIFEEFSNLLLEVKVVALEAKYFQCKQAALKSNYVDNGSIYDDCDLDELPRTIH